jgi:carbon storage regulator
MLILTRRPGERIVIGPTAAPTMTLDLVSIGYGRASISVCADDSNARTIDVGQQLQVDADVGVTLLGLRGNQARLGIDAPKSLLVHRYEVHQRIAAEQQIAARRLATRTVRA